MGFLDSMKDFAGKVGNTVEKGAKSVSDGSKKMAEKSKIKKEISQLEAEINSAYISIGKVYFDRIAASPEPECQNAVETIVKTSERLEKLRMSLCMLDDKLICSSCGADVARGQKFCDKCGAKIDEIIIEEKEEPVITSESVNVSETVDIPESVNTSETISEYNGKVCPECNTPVEDDQQFCVKCGRKL